MSHPAFDSLWDGPAKKDDPLDALWADRAPPHDYHAEFKSGALQRRMARANQGDTEVAAAEDEDAQPGVLGSLADAAQGIPGVGALQAGARAVVRGQSYPDAYRDIKGQTDKVPTSAKLIGRTAASLPLTQFLPGSAVRSGALIGAADPLLSGDPNSGLGDRAGRAAVGAGVGALAGRALEMAGTGLRALRTPLAEDNIAAQQAARRASGDALYGKALAEGQGKTDTPEIRRVLAEPDNAALMEAQAGMRQNQGRRLTDPEMLDALYKMRSDIKGRLERGLDSPLPNRPNVGRASLLDNSMAQQDLVDAMSGGRSLPGPMPTYRTAVEDQARRFSNIDATREGQDYLRAALRKTVTPGRSLEQTTPRALGDWAALPTTTPENRQFMAQGILGGAREDVAEHPINNLIGGLFGRRALGKAPDLLRRAQDATQARNDFLTKVGLLFGANDLRN